MAKSSKKKRAAQYSSNTLAAFTAVGIVLIAMGLISLLAVVGNIGGAVFSYIRNLMYGLGGGLCVGISVLLIWLGVLVAFSAGRSMPKRAFVLIAVLFVAVLGMINLLSRIGDVNLMDYLVSRNNRRQPPVVNATGFRQMVTAVYEFGGEMGSFGGVIGMLLAWPAWTFLGTTLGAVALGVICLACVLLLSRFDMMQMVEAIRNGWHSRAQRNAEKREEEAQRQLIEEQQRQAEEEERLRLSPAYLRRAPEQVADPQQQPIYAPPPAAMQPPQTYVQPQPPQGEIYDEIIVPKDHQLPWKKNAKKAESAKLETQPVAYQTRMTFTPSEVGNASEEPAKPDTMILSVSRKKALERIEAIRKRKAELTEEIEGSEAAARLENTFAPQIPSPAEPVKTTFQPEVSQTVYPVEMDDPQDEEETPAEIMPVQSAYQRPKDTPRASQTQTDTIPYAYPSIDLLNAQLRRETTDTRAADAEDAARLEKTLESFGIPARVQRVTHGPAVTRFELGLTSSGINVKRIMGIADNIALDMAANGGVRIEIPIPGTNLFGVEIPNREIQSVMLSEVLMSNEMRTAKSPLAVALGKDIAGRPVICDIAKMPHLLIAGQTGSGKSVCINTIINSILFRSSPEEVRMIMIDPKVVELQCYNVVPHLLIPVVSDPHKAAGALQWAVAEMLDRYHKMQSKNVRELSAYNAKLEPGEPKLPRIVIIIDELADLMLACKKEVEDSIIRIAQLARAAGIHMVVATQRPTVDVITGLIKANIPSRIAFAVASSIDSRTILDQNGAEKLLGKGDMFFFPTGASAPIRVQGCFMSDAETERVVDYIGTHSRVDFDPDVIEAMESDEDSGVTMADHDEDSGVDEKLAEAIDMVITDGQASISMLQRRMKIGYARAGRLIDDMAARGIVSKSAGSKPREVLISREQFEQMKDSLGL